MNVMADQHTGGMIALVPADPETLTVPGGDPAEELHLTLAFLGDDVSAFTEEHRAELAKLVQSIADPPESDGPDVPYLLSERGPVMARVWAHAVFNPGPDGAVVYMVKDDYDPDDPDVSVPTRSRRWLLDMGNAVAFRARDVLGVLMAKQHSPWQPHVTAGWVSQGLGADALEYAGPVVFDRIRLALGDQVQDFPLSSEPVAEVKYQSPDPRARRLAKWWARNPKGRARWQPGTPGDYNRLRAALRKEIGAKMPQRVLDGLAANIHKMATGEWPGPKAHGGKKSVTPANEEIKAVADLDDDELMAKLDEYENMGDDLTVEEIYEEAVQEDRRRDAEESGETEAYEAAETEEYEAAETEAAEVDEVSDTESEEDDEDEDDPAKELAGLFASVFADRSA